MQIAIYLLGSVALVAVAVSLGTGIATWCMLGRRRGDQAQGPLPPISVLKPLKGLDDGLRANLIALLEQDYPRFEVICGTADADDPAVEVVRSLMPRHPHLRLVTGAPLFGLNPKVSNLAHMAPKARYDHILISDANVRPTPDYLRQLAGEMSDPAVGLVHSLLVGVGEASLGAELENLHLNTWVISGVAGAEVLAGRACVVGKSMLMRRSQLKLLGNWHSVRNVLAEDYVLGRRFATAGFRVALSTHLLPTVNERRTVRDFGARHLRWSQMRRRLAPLAYLGEPLLNPTALLLPAVVAAAWSGATGWLVLLASAGLGKLGGDLLLLTRLRQRAPAARDAALLVLKDLVIAAVWAAALVRRRIVWRGNVMRVGPGSVLEPWPIAKAADAAALAEAA